jgi:hypothetical protein
VYNMRTLQEQFMRLSGNVPKNVVVRNRKIYTHTEKGIEVRRIE